MHLDWKVPCGKYPLLFEFGKYALSRRPFKPAHTIWGEAHFPSCNQMSESTCLKTFLVPFYLLSLSHSTPFAQYSTLWFACSKVYFWPVKDMKTLLAWCPFPNPLAQNQMVFKYSQSELRMLSANNVKGVKKRDSQAKQFDTLPAQQASERSFQFHINFFFFNKIENFHFI